MNITLDEIKSKAPKGATHYDINDYEYFKRDGEKWYWWAFDVWVSSVVVEGYFNKFIKPL